MPFYWKQETCFGSPLDCLGNNEKVLVSPVICHNNSNMVIFFLKSRKVYKSYMILIGTYRWIHKKQVYEASLLFSLCGQWQAAHCWSYHTAVCATADPIPSGHTSISTPGLWVNWCPLTCKSCKHSMSMEQAKGVIWLKSKEQAVG